jgi:hypothetical protein
MIITINDDEFELIKSGNKKWYLLTGIKFLNTRDLFLLVNLPVRKELKVCINSIKYNDNNTIIEFEVISTNG